MAYIHVRLNGTRDQDIIAWLDAQENKTYAVKAAIRAAIEDKPAAIDLSAIRTVFEAVLDERLTGLALTKSAGPPHGEDPELAGRLDAMF